MPARNSLRYSFGLICGLLLVSTECAAQVSAGSSCTPVVYAFRHAEDVNGPPPKLTDEGDQHAQLYPSMIYDFQFSHNYCPVGFVYSMYDRNPNTDPGTTNPYETAAPLALRACDNLYSAIVVEAGIFAPYPVNPDDCGSHELQPPISGGSFPHMALRDGNQLYEYLGTVKAEQNAKAGTSATFDDLRAELLSNTSYVPPAMDAETGLSSAIFWTSQGLNLLGQGIVANFKGIPVTPKPPRNAVYVFEYQDGAFIPPTNVNRYRQCFNVNASKEVGGTTYYCSASGNLPADLKNLPALRGKICDTTNLGSNCVMSN
jgi:hypothetical protein